MWSKRSPYSVAWINPRARAIEKNFYLEPRTGCPRDGITTTKAAENGTLAWWEIIAVSDTGGASVGSLKTLRPVATPLDTFAFANGFPVSCGHFHESGHAFWYGERVPPGGWAKWDDPVSVSSGLAWRCDAPELEKLANDANTEILRAIDYEWNCCPPKADDSGYGIVYVNGGQVAPTKPGLLPGEF
jgi:hypothetical protein